MNEATVSLRRPGARAVTSSEREVAASGFQIEVPPHLARELGLTVLVPLNSKIIRCDRPAFAAGRR